MRVMEELKKRINQAVTTGRKWPNVVNVGKEYYGIYFIKKDIFVIWNGTDIEIDELSKETVEAITEKLEANDFEPNKSFVG